MEKQTPQEFAKEFINDFLDNPANLNLNKDVEINFGKEVLEDDPNLKILKEELNKIGFDIFQQENKNFWTIKKIK